MANLRDDLWSVWHKKENRAEVVKRLEMITRIEKKRKSAADKVCVFRDEKSHEHNRRMLKYWEKELDYCAYELCGIANGLLGKEMP